MSTPYSLPLQVMTYNVHLFGSIGTYLPFLGYQDSARTTALIGYLKNCGADIIGLQEVWDVDLAAQIEDGVKDNYWVVQGDPLLLDVAVYVDQFSTLPTHLHGVGCGLMLLASKNSVVGVGHVKSDRFPIAPTAVDIQDAFAQKGYLKAQLHMKTGDLRMGVLVSHMITNLSTYTSSGEKCFDAIQSRIESYRSKSQYPKAPFFLMADLNVTGESYSNGGWSSTANYGSYVSQYLLNDGASTLLTDTWRACNSDLTTAPGFTVDETINNFTESEDEDNDGDSATQKRIDYILYAGGAQQGGASVSAVSSAVLNGSDRPQYTDTATDTLRDLSDHFALTANFTVSWSS